MSYNVFHLYMNYHYSLCSLSLTQSQIALSPQKSYCLYPRETPPEIYSLTIIICLP